MSKVIDISGQKFGRLTAIKRGPNISGSKIRWICICECGNPNEILVRADALKCGSTKSCGCIKKEKDRIKAKIIGDANLDPRNTNTHRYCAVCENVKKIEEFCSNKKTAIGINYTCRMCAAQQFVNYKNKDPRRTLLRSAKARAKRDKLKFDIDIDDIIIPASCPYLGIPLFSGKKGNPNSPSLDKIIPKLGYTKGNVIVVSRRANVLKLDASVEELEMLSLNLRKVVDAKNISSKEQKDSGISEKRRSSECVKGI